MTVHLLPEAPAAALPGDQARRRWLTLDAAERAELLLRLEEKVVVPRPLTFYVGDDEYVNDTAVETIRAVRDKPVDQWSYSELILLTALWLWDVGGFAVSELNQADLTFSLLDDFVVEKLGAYRKILGLPAEADRDVPLFDRYASLAPMRRTIEQDHVRCMRINGATWERREWFLPHSDVDPNRIPDRLSDTLRERTGIDLPDGPDYLARFTGFTEALLEAGINPAEALVAMAEDTVRDDDLACDYAIITCARGNKLSVPETIQMKDVLSYTAIREGMEPRERGVRLNREQIANAICQRMRYNVVCRVRNYSSDRAERMQAQAFQIPDIATMEDAHHNGHRANGVRFVARSPIVFDVPGEHGVRTLKGLADFRVNRATHDESRQFTAAELTVILRTSWWMRVVAQVSWSHGVLFDEKYCTKLESYTDKDGAELSSRRARILGKP